MSSSIQNRGRANCLKQPEERLCGLSTVGIITVFHPHMRLPCHHWLLDKSRRFHWLERMNCCSRCCSCFQSSLFFLWCNFFPWPPFRCNKMTCSQCSASFCYKCGKLGGYEHFTNSRCQLFTYDELVQEQRAAPRPRPVPEVRTNHHGNLVAVNVNAVALVVMVMLLSTSWYLCSLGDVALEDVL